MRWSQCPSLCLKCSKYVHNHIITVLMSLHIVSKQSLAFLICEMPFLPEELINYPQARQTTEEASCMLCQHFIALSWMLRRGCHAVQRLINKNPTRVTLDYWRPPPSPERKRKIYSSTWDSIILRSLLWGLNLSVVCFNQDQKKGNNSTSDRNLNVALTSWSTSLRVKTAIPCVLFLNFENGGEQQVDGWLS